MKKLISVLMIVALMAAFMVVSAFAAETPQIVVDSADAATGETVVLKVSLKNNPGITNGKMTVTFDEDAFEFVKIAGTIESVMEYGFTIMNNGATMNFVATSDVDADLALFEVHLKVKDEAVGEYKIGLDIQLMKNNAEEDVVFEIVEGTVNVTYVCKHPNLIHKEAIEPACHYDGLYEHWFCPDCNGFWADEALTQVTNSKNVIAPALGGEVVHVEAVEPTCMQEGNIEHWYCEECNQVWQDEALTQLTNHQNVKLGLGDHKIVHMEAVEPGCHYEGHVEHWYCTVCGCVWTDEALTQVSNHQSVIVPELGGEVIHVEAVPHTCTEDGNIEYWYCEECMQVWQDEALTQLTNIKNVVDPAAHTYVDGVCIICGEKDPNPETGDFVYVAVATALVSMMGIVALTKKKEY